MPLNYNKSRKVYGPTENELKNRNNTVREVLNAKGIPRNVGNEEILRRVKVYNNVMSGKLRYPIRNFVPIRTSGREKKMKIANFISNGRVFNQRKRKALVELMLRFDFGQPYRRGEESHIWEMLALKNEDVIRYIKYMADYFGTDGAYERTNYNTYKPLPHFIANLMYKRRYRVQRGPIREDPEAVRVLKKRTAFLKEMLKIRGKRYTLNRDNLPRNMQNKFPNGNVSRNDMWRYMEKEFPLPPHPKNAATKIQSAFRGMRNRKKLTTMRKAATTIQKRARGMSTRKKMKTVAGKRKASTSIKTTSVKRTKTNR
jgi:hypothetical protein